MNPYYIGLVLKLESDQLNKHIDNIVSNNLVETNGDGLLLHPLVNDFYLKLARSNSNFKFYSEQLSEIAQDELAKIDNLNKNFVYWLVLACRLLFYCGKYNESKSLRNDLLGELKNAAIKLYERRDYPQSLTYCDEYLGSIPDDRDILFTKARCLSRLGKVGEAVDQLEYLRRTESNKYQLSKINYALGRTFMENSQNNQEENLNNAEHYLLESIKINEHSASLQSMGELLYRRNKLKEAASFIERKLYNSPTDPFALSIYSDILWDSGRKSEAVGKIIEALKHQPKNPNFLFRAGRFLQYLNDSAKAYGFFYQAVEYDDTYFDARLSLADVCLDLDYLQEAKKHIDYLDEKVKGEKRNILDSIIANYCLKTGEVLKAEEIANHLLKGGRIVPNLGLMAKIYIFKFKENMRRELLLLASMEKSKALELIEEGLKMEPLNERLIAMKYQLASQ